MSATEANELGPIEPQKLGVNLIGEVIGNHIRRLGNTFSPILSTKNKCLKNVVKVFNRDPSDISDISPSDG